MSTRLKNLLTCEDCNVQFTATLARWCPNCRWKHRGKTAKKYPWTPERDELLRKRYDGKVKNRAAEIARSVGWPTWVIKKRAQALGLSYPVDRKDWTPEETKFLLDHTGNRTSHWIAKNLSRSETSVVLKCKRLKISRRVRIGYTLRELELCFGIDHHGIERWVKDGKLKVRRRGTARTHTGDIWRVSDEAILASSRKIRCPSASTRSISSGSWI